MDRHRFEALTRLLAAGSRRVALLTFASGLLGLGALPHAVDLASARKRRHKHNKHKKTRQQKKRRQKRHVEVEGPCGNGSGKANRCKRDRQCCTNYCKKRRCRCRKEGQPCNNDPQCCPGRTGRTCQDGACQLASSTCADTCAGCCDAETCRPGTADAACGMGGEACQECDDPRFCADGICTSPPACGDVCASGCLYGSVQEAIEFAEDGDTITICPGTYIENLLIDKDLTLIGRGQGSDPATDTILDGGGAGPVIVVDAGMVSLASLRITGGNTINGGGIGNGGTLEMSDCAVSGNMAVNGGGGGIYNDAAATLILSGCTVSGNTASFDGGGIANPAGTLEMTDCTVSGNTVTSETGFGGGIYNQNTVTLTNCTISDNAAGFGGGIYNFGTVELVDGATVTVNHADVDGGGIFNDGALGVGASNCSGGSSVTGNTVGPPPGVPNDCVAGGGGNCNTC